MVMKLATAVEVSQNSKLGRISATYASQESCPKSCPLFGNGCYAEQGPTAFTTNRLNNAGVASPIEVAKQEAIAIDQLTGKLPLRAHVVGDCSTDEAASLVGDAMVHHSSKHNQPSWTYTHSWKDVKRSSWGDTSVLASVEKVSDITKAWQKGYATALVVESHPSKKAYKLDGATILPCPAEQNDNITCESCRLCTIDHHLRSKKLTIGFSAHGARKGKVIEQIRTN